MLRGGRSWCRGRGGRGVGRLVLGLGCRCREERTARLLGGRTVDGVSFRDAGDGKRDGRYCGCLEGLRDSARGGQVMVESGEQKLAAPRGAAFWWIGDVVS